VGTVKRAQQIASHIIDAINDEIPTSNAGEMLVGVLLAVDNFLARAPGDELPAELVKLRNEVGSVLAHAWLAMVALESEGKIQ
jgi:hypothetical protein